MSCEGEEGWGEHRSGLRNACGRHVPFEFIGKVTSSSAMAKASDIQGGS